MVCNIKRRTFAATVLALMVSCNMPMSNIAVNALMSFSANQKTDVNIVHMSLGSWGVFALDDEGFVWSWGLGDEGGGRIARPSANNATAVKITQTADGSLLPRIKKVSNAADNGLLLDVNGDIWTYSRSNYNNITNALARPVSGQSYARPGKVIFSGGQKIKDIAAGAWGFKCIDTQGNLWSWGFGESGGIGNGATANTTQPEMLLTDSQGNPLPKFIAVESSDYNTTACAIALTESGNLYTWGNTAAVGGSLRPSLVTEAPANIKKIDCSNGGWGFLTESGELFTWGTNGGLGLGYLGYGSISASSLPVKLPPPDDGGHWLDFSMYAWSTAALSSNGKVYGCGGNVGNSHGFTANKLTAVTHMQGIVGTPVSVCQGYSALALLDSYGNMYVSSDDLYAYNRGRNGKQTVSADAWVAFPQSKAHIKSLSGDEGTSSLMVELSSPAERVDYVILSKSDEKFEPNSPQLTITDIDQTPFPLAAQLSSFYDLTYAQLEDEHFVEGTDQRILLSPSYNLDANANYANPRISEEVFERAYDWAQDTKKGIMAAHSGNLSFSTGAVITENCTVWIQTRNSAGTHRMVYEFTDFESGAQPNGEIEIVERFRLYGDEVSEISPNGTSFVPMGEAYTKTSRHIQGYVPVGWVRGEYKVDMDDATIHHTTQNGAIVQASFAADNTSGEFVTFIYRHSAEPVTISWVGQTYGGNSVVFETMTINGYVGENVTALITPNTPIDLTVWTVADSDIPTEVILGEQPLFFQQTYKEQIDLAVITLFGTSTDGALNFSYTHKKSLGDPPFEVTAWPLVGYEIVGYAITDVYGNQLEAGNSSVVTVNPAKGNQQVYFTYAATISTVIVKAVDQAGVELLEDISVQTKTGDRYSVIAPHLDGYTLDPWHNVVKVLDPVLEGTNVVVFSYTKIQPGEILLILKEAEDRIIKTISVAAGTTIALPPALEHDYYSLDSEKTQQAGTTFPLTADSTAEIYYVKDTVDVAIHALDSEGTLLGDVYYDRARKGEMYQATAQEIGGHLLKGAASKQVYADPEAEVIEVTFIYEKASGITPENHAIARIICYDAASGQEFYEKLVGGLAAGDDFAPNAPNMSDKGYTAGVPDPSNPLTLSAGENHYRFGYQKDPSRWSTVFVAAVYPDQTEVPLNYYPKPPGVEVLKGEPYNATAPFVAWHALYGEASKTVAITEDTLITFEYVPVRQNVEVRAITPDGVAIKVNRYSEIVSSTATYYADAEFGVIPGWRLADQPSKQITVGTADVVEFIYQRHSRNVAVVLKDQNGDVISLDALADVGVGETVTVSAPHIEGYMLDMEKNPPAVTIAMPEGTGDYQVVFCYKSAADIAELTVVGRSDQAELYRYVISGKIGISKEIGAITTANYTVSEQMKRVVFGVDTEVVFNYVSNLRTVLVKAQDADGNPINGYLDKSHSVPLGNNFTAHAPVIPDWVIANGIHQQTLVVTKDTSIVFTYKKVENMLLIKGVNEYGTSLKVVGKPLENGLHTISFEELGEITGWRLISPENVQVNIPDDREAVFAFDEDLVTVTVKGMDQQSGAELFRKEHSVQNAAHFTGGMEFLPGYTLLDGEPPLKTLAAHQGAEIVFLYEVTTLPVRVIHKTTDGSILLVEDDSAASLSQYTAQSMMFSGYKLLSERQQTATIPAVGECVFTFVYEVNSTEVIINLADGSTGSTVDSFRLTAQREISTTIYAPALPGYVIEGADRQTFVPTNGDILIFYYTKISDIVSGSHFTVHVIGSVYEQDIELYAYPLRLDKTNGVHRIEAFALEGYRIVGEQAVDVPLDGSVTKVEFAYEPSLLVTAPSPSQHVGTLSVTITTASTGATLSGAKVEITHDQQTDVLTTSPQGTVSLSDATPGVYTIKASWDDYRPGVAVTELTEQNGDRDVHIALSRTISGGGGASIATPVPPIQPNPEQGAGIEDSLEAQRHIAFIYGYPNGEIMPDASITRAEVAAVFFRLSTDPNKNSTETPLFMDVGEDEWYFQMVNYLAGKGLVQGYGGQLFDPAKPITRAEFTAIAARFDNRNGDSKVVFPDVPADHWAQEYIAHANENGWIGGYPGGEFQPDRFISRAEAVKVVNAMLNRKTHAKDLPADLPKYADLSAEHWAYAEIMEASVEHDYERQENDWEIWIKE